LGEELAIDADLWLGDYFFLDELTETREVYFFPWKLCAATAVPLQHHHLFY